MTFVLQPCGCSTIWRISGDFSPLSACPGQVAYALRTRPPVVGSALLRPATPRLACVRPAASVHPEPGSNSSLYELLLYLFDSSSHLSAPPLWKGLQAHAISSLSSVSTYSRPPGHKLSLFNSPLTSKASAKIQPFSLPAKFFFTKNLSPDRFTLLISIVHRNFFSSNPYSLPLRQHRFGLKKVCCPKKINGRRCEVMNILNYYMIFNNIQVKNLLFPCFSIVASHVLVDGSPKKARPLK